MLRKNIFSTKLKCYTYRGQTRYFTLREDKRFKEFDRCQEQYTDP